MAEISSEESEEGEERPPCMNEVVMRVFKSKRFRLPKKQKKEVVKPRQSDAKILPEYRLKVPKDDTKKFFHRPSLACVEGTPFEVSYDYLFFLF